MPPNVRPSLRSFRSGGRWCPPGYYLPACAPSAAFWHSPAAFLQHLALSPPVHSVLPHSPVPWPLHSVPPIVAAASSPAARISVLAAFTLSVLGCSVGVELPPHAVMAIATARATPKNITLTFFMIAELFRIMRRRMRQITSRIAVQIYYIVPILRKSDPH